MFPSGRSWGSFTLAATDTGCATFIVLSSAFETFHFVLHFVVIVVFSKLRRDGPIAHVVIVVHSVAIVIIIVADMAIIIIVITDVAIIIIVVHIVIIMGVVVIITHFCSATLGRAAAFDSRFEFGENAFYLMNQSR
jgi:hypothetical protein